MSRPAILICTVGTSLFRPNLENLKKELQEGKIRYDRRTRALRTPARRICAVVRERSAAACALNATGGYKAQIAVAVLLGQALGVPVYYKHELFSEIIAFPPLPVALDFEVWMRASGMLY